MNKEEAKVRIDSIINHLEWRHGGGTDYVESDRDQAHQIIDQIEPDHQKVKLPREVGEELDDWKKSNFDENLSGYIEDVDAGLDDVEKAMSWIYHRDDTSEQKRTELYGILADAYRYGWEAEPEAKWYVKTPEAWENEDGEFGWLYKPICGGVDTASHGGEENEQFTRSEIKKYHFDSDIFTLVPVENEEVSR